MKNIRTASVVAASVLILAACGGSTSSASPDGDAASPALVSEVETTPLGEITANHVDPPVLFSTSPSTGGDHFPFWMNCGFYTEQVIEGAATHSLEHGAIWITYSESLDDDEIAALELLSQENPRLLISPYEQDDPIILSAWGAQQRGVASANAPELAAFIAEWLDNPSLIEAGASCNGAVGNPPGDPNSLADGTAVPDEFLS